MPDPDKQSQQPAAADRPESSDRPSDEPRPAAGAPSGEDDARRRLQERIEDSIGSAGAGPAA